MKRESVLVVFGEELPRSFLQSGRRYDVVIAPEKLQHHIETTGSTWKGLEEYVSPGSVQEASRMVEELTHLTFPDGTPLPTAVRYKGYDLWWLNYQSLYLYFCLPYTQYQKLLSYVKDFQDVYFERAPFPSLFASYLKAHECRSHFSHVPSKLPFGIFIQMVLTLVFLPFLIAFRRPVLVFTGDKFEKDRDHDFRLRFIYEELRARRIPFMECIRSLEKSKTLCAHVWTRKRPVFYPEAVTFLARGLNRISGGSARGIREFGAHRFTVIADRDIRFKHLIATKYLLTIHEDIWAIRIMRVVVRLIGVKAAIIVAATERNFHTVLACKLENIPTIGILHGAHSRYYNVYEFMPGYNGEKKLSVDRYGLWSSWWREFFITHSDAYKPEQLFVAGLMRPLIRTEPEGSHASSVGKTRVLFVSEQLAPPREVLPYLRALLAREDTELKLKVRPYRDGFEAWLMKYEPDLLSTLAIVRTPMQEAVKDCEVVVGAHSTAVLEALLELKMPVFFETQKWGDYFDIQDFGDRRQFYATNPAELISRVQASRTIDPSLLVQLRERYFGDPYKNGSQWVVEQAEQLLRQSR